MWIASNWMEMKPNCCCLQEQKIVKILIRLMAVGVSTEACGLPLTGPSEIETKHSVCGVVCT